MGVPGKTEGTIFSPIPCEVILTGPERVGGRKELINYKTHCMVLTYHRVRTGPGKFWKCVKLS